MPFRAVLKTPLSFRKLVEIFRNLVDVINLDVSQEGFNIITIDSAHVFVVELTLHANDAFSVYTCSPKSLTFGLRLQSLHQVFQNAGADDNVELWTSDDETFNVTVHRAVNHVQKRSEYKIKQIMVLNQERLLSPSLEYRCELLLPTYVITEICSELKGMGEHLLIKVTPEEVLFDASGEDVEAQITISASRNKNIPEFAIVCDAPQQQLFKFGFFQKMGGACKIPEAKVVLIQLGPEAPLSLLFQLEGLGSLQFYLAPLLEHNS